MASCGGQSSANYQFEISVFFIQSNLNATLNNKTNTKANFLWRTLFFLQSWPIYSAVILCNIAERSVGVCYSRSRTMCGQCWSHGIANVSTVWQTLSDNVVVGATVYPKDRIDRGPTLRANAIKDYAGGRNRSNNAGLLLLILSRYCTIVSRAMLNREIKVKVEWNRVTEGEREERTTQLYKTICGLAINILKTDLHEETRPPWENFVKISRQLQRRNFSLDSRYFRVQMWLESRNSKSDRDWRGTVSLFASRCRVA